jgi:hypothetical protein
MSWSEVIRRAPTGILVLGTLLFFIGAGFVLGGAYLGLTREDVGWGAWATALLMGPVVVYVALHLVRLTRWAWLSMVLTLALLLISSIARALGSSEIPLAPLLEAVAEIGFLAYLSRPPIRRAFRKE